MLLTKDQFEVFVETIEEEEVEGMEANEESVKLFISRENDEEIESVRFWSDGSVDRRLGTGNVSNFYDVIEVEEVS